MFGDAFRNFTKDIPGPGTYQTPGGTLTESLTPTGRYFNSKFASSKASVFNPARSPRFNDKLIMK